jgi:hypothetical protein
MFRPGRSPTGDKVVRLSPFAPRTVWGSAWNDAGLIGVTGTVRGANGDRPMEVSPTRSTLASASASMRRSLGCTGRSASQAPTINNTIARTGAQLVAENDEGALVSGSTWDGTRHRASSSSVRGMLRAINRSV